MCETCCNETFSIKFLLDQSGISDIKIYQGPKCTIIIAYRKNNKVHMLISYDCGKSFVEKHEVFDVVGKIRDLQILADESQFVIALIETKVDGGDLKRAISGKLQSSDGNIKFSYKKCENFEPQKDEKIIGMSLGFRPMETDPATIESVDYIFIRVGDNVRILCVGHGCIIKE